MTGKAINIEVSKPLKLYRGLTVKYQAFPLLMQLAVIIV